MGGTPTPPPGFKLGAPPPPPGFKLDNSPSVMDPKSQPTLGQKFKQIGKSLAAPVAGMGTAVEGAEIGGALAGPPGAIIAPGGPASAPPISAPSTAVPMPATGAARDLPICLNF